VSDKRTSTTGAAGVFEWVPASGREAGVSTTQPERQTIKRRSDEPKLEIGATIEIKEGVIGVVVARYTPSGGRSEVHYIVEQSFLDGKRKRLAGDVR